jgi:hypothetical protein
MPPAALANATGASAAARLHPTLVLCLAGIVLPNMLSLVALAGGIGSPPRTTAILCYAIVALAARTAPVPIIVAAYAATAIYDAISTIALQFGLAPSEIGLALHLASELEFDQSPFYLSLMASLLALAGGTVAILVRQRDALRRGSVSVLMALALLLAGVDFLSNTSAHYQFGSIYGANKPMESAAVSSGFRDAVLRNKPPRVLVVVVEAMGKFADPARQDILLKPFRDPALLARYRVTTGSTTHYGSTTAGEMRELCDTREPYAEVAAGKGANCLPRLLAAGGYRTVALHNFTNAFFDRSQWYPEIGFQTRLFEQDLRGRKLRQCGGPFRAPCDLEMLPLIERRFREAKEPLFYYWLTLSTHVPIKLGEGTPRLGCANQGGAIGHTEVCHMTEMWLDLFQGIAKLTETIGPAEILIVGDHGPPLWSRAGRALFEPGQVTWIRLAPRGAAK